MKRNEQDVLSECERLEVDGLHQQAVILLSEAISSSPSAELYFRRGDQHERLREFQAAFDDYSAAIELNPTSRRYWVAKGQVLYNHLENVFQAIDDFDEAVSVDPTSAIPHYHLCFCYLLLGNLDFAFEHANRTLQLNPTDAISHHCLAKCHLAAGSVPSALRELQVAASLEPQNWLYWSDIARLLSRDGRISEALEYYKKAAEIESSAMRYISVAAVQLELGNPDDAIATLNMARNFQMNEAEKLLVNGYFARANMNKTEKTG